MPLLTITENFLYESPDVWNPAAVGEAFQRAVALAETCETDLKTLEDFFGVSGGFGPSNRVTILIDNSISPGALGINQGYQKDGQSKITIVPFTGSANADAAVRAVFVAEMSEILMDFRNQVTRKKTWLAGNSMGEALSTVCEGLLHPEGYFGAPINGPRIRPWLNYLNAWPLNWRRPNWIDVTENTDQNFVSFGCGIVFIYYLRSQLGHSIQEIIAKGGSTFEETYHNLTGTSGGWTAFTNLLDLYFPEVGPVTIYKPSDDNLFPLPRLVALVLAPATVVAGKRSVATITLDSPHDAFTWTVTLLSADPGFATVPVNLPIPAGSSSAKFTVNTPALMGAFEPAHVLIYASGGGATVTATLTVIPAIAVGTLKSLTLNPSTVTGGGTSVGTVTLEAPVSTPTVVGLAATESGSGPGPPHGSPSAIASVKPSVTIAAGDTQATFLIHTSVIALPGSVRTATIVAGAVVTRFAILTVEHS